MQDSTFSRDLLQRFIIGNHLPRKIAEGDAEEDLELSLGLSSNGRFGVDPERTKNLSRASSVSNFVMSSSIDETAAFLARASSLPVETAEEWRKRKELQSIRRLEAKRKRLEKLKNVRLVKGKFELEQNPEEKVRGSLQIDGSERGSVLGGGGAMEGLKSPPILSQGSIGSQGSASSGVSDFESQPRPGTLKYSESRSPTIEQIEPKSAAAVNPRTTNDKSSKGVGPAMECPSAKAVVVPDREEANEVVKNMLADMPCVSTKVDGPNGKKIEGFLYRYKKGEEVRIVCVCHGSFLSPAEFVKHGGGGDVAHPLKHIVVCPPPFL